MSLFIAIPSRGGIDGTLTEEMLRWLKPYHDAHVEVMPGCCWVDYARAYLVGRFYASKCDELLFIDDDVHWDDRTLVRRMQGTKLGLVTCAYASRAKGHPLTLVVPDEGTLIWKANGHRVVNVRTNGLGCTLIRREVIEEMWNYAPRAIAEDSTEMRMFFQPSTRYIHDVERHRGDDDTFFDRLYDRGYPMACMVDARLVHAGISVNLADKCAGLLAAYFSG